MVLPCPSTFIVLRTKIFQACARRFSNEGCEVEILGLKSAQGQELNGKTGTLSKFNPKNGRWNVLIENRNFSLKPENFRIIKKVTNLKFHEKLEAKKSIRSNLLGSLKKFWI